MSLSSERDREVLRSFARRIDPSDAGAHNNLGVLYYNKGLYEEAVAAFMKALELEPKMSVAQRNLEITYFNTGYYDTRLPQLRDRLRVRPEDRNARWELGRTLALLGKQEEAAAEFRELLAYAPNDVAALLQLALAEKQSGAIESAQQCIERALTLDGESSLLHFALGEVLYHRGLNEEALRALERAIDLNPENYDALYLMGFVLGDIGRHAEAQEVTRRAVKLNPALSRSHANLSIEHGDTPPSLAHAAAGREELQVSGEGQLARYNLGLAFRSKGYYAEALREYGIALERGEERDLVLQAMAEVHLLSGRPADALPIYDDLLRRQGSSPKLWNERGVSLHQLGRFAEAELSYMRAVEDEPAYSIAHNNLGVSRYHRGATDAAIESFHTALATHSDFAKARLNYALLLTRSKRLSQALDVYRAVLASEAENAVAWNGVGLILADLQRHEEAKNAFARAIQSRPSFAQAHYNMSFTLSNLGDFEGALRETRQALELDPYYVPQKFELAMDFEYEDPDLSIQPDFGAERKSDDAIADFTFDVASLDGLFTELAPPQKATPASSRSHDSSPYAMATDFLSKGLLDRASAEINRVVARGAPAAEGSALKAEVFARQGLYGEALERFREAQRLDPTNALARIGEVRCLIRLGRPREARPIADRLVSERPHDVETLMLAASACADTGNPASALTLLANARHIAPHRADVLQRTGDVSRLIGDVDTAIEVYRAALDLDEGFVIVRVQLAKLLEEKGDNVSAERELRVALETLPTYAEATLALAVLCSRLGRHDESLDLLIELLRRDSYHFAALIALGDSLVAMGRRDDAAHAFTRVVRFDPTHVVALSRLAAVRAAAPRKIA
jgi:tetratricopeptide (TPR) repeat protein